MRRCIEAYKWGQFLFRRLPSHGETICDNFAFDARYPIALNPLRTSANRRSLVSPTPSERRDSSRDLAADLDLLNQLQAALRNRDRSRQIDVIRELLHREAALGDQWQSLAVVALRLGEIGLARQAIDRFVLARGDGAYARYQKASLLEQAGALREAYDLIRTLPDDAPEPAANAYSRGTAALFLGENEEARHQLERATRLQPGSGAAWLSLAMATDMEQGSELTDRLLAAERAMAAAPVPQQSAYQYALGKTRADRQEHELAAAAFARGAQLAQEILRYDRTSDRAHAAEATAGYTREAIDLLASCQDQPSGSTIFVTGLPRSGTTLVQQVLVSHSAIDEGAEIDRLPMLAREIGGHSQKALGAYVHAKGVSEAAQLWQHWIEERFPTARRVVDKSLSTTRYLGLAASLLPDAPLVWMTRNPLDCAWSCFRTFFEARLPWSYDLEDIAWHFRLEDELLATWREILGERLLVIPYEALVTDPHPWIRRLLAHCGLEEEPQVFEPHLAGRQVTTASTLQVRQPINRNGIDAAEPYREFLAPFLQAYSG